MDMHIETDARMMPIETAHVLANTKYMIPSVHACYYEPEMCGWRMPCHEHVLQPCREVAASCPLLASHPHQNDSAAEMSSVAVCTQPDSRHLEHVKKSADQPNR